MAPVGRDGFIVKILRHDSPARAAGIGFVVGEKHIVTCAHVVNTALGRPQRAQDQPGPAEQLRVEFPILGDKDGAPSRVCRVECWQAPPAEMGSGGDVAGLVVVGERLPDRAGPARLISDDRFRGRTVEVFGYPADRRELVNGAWAALRLRSAVEGGFVQLDAEEDSAVRAQPGYSGSPIVAADAEGDAVIGMFARAWEEAEDGRDTYAIPVTQLAATWPAVLGAPEVLGAGPEAPAAGLRVRADPAARPVSPYRDFTNTFAKQTAAPPAQPPVTAPPAAQRPTAPEPGLQQPSLPQVIAGTWAIDIQSPMFGRIGLLLGLMISPSGQLQFQGTFQSVNPPERIEGYWGVMGNQVTLSGRRMTMGPWARQAPYESVVTFTSWSYSHLTGVTLDGERVTWHRQG
jgi:V8-like Glu-specific endopeptidase